ncbi:Uncharacterised protein [Mycobacteroides abscessus subsp. abscessus]|nr:Uncharacterised protein [Mycobacteroides abscessus subsp. abscessus]
MLASDPIAEVAEDHGPERPEEESGGADAEGEQQRIGLPAEELLRQRRRDVEEDREVIPFDDGAEGGDEHRAAASPLLLGRACPCLGAGA